MVPPAISTRGSSNGGRLFADYTKSNLDAVAARVKIDSKSLSGANLSLVVGDFFVGHVVGVDKDFGIVDVDLD